ncbi:MAG: dependent protein [Chloroflexota bacterium]|nr:dependent protein [Chloroflexota bacterium]
MAASKYVDAAGVTALARAGQRVFGESRVQDALDKISAVTAPSLEWHMIGHLQTNKVARAAGAFAMIQSVDSIHLAEAISARAGEAPVDVLLEVNVAGDPAKSGFTPAEAEAGLSRLAALPGVLLRGLMTIGPLTDDPEGARPTFAGLRLLRDRLDAQGSAPSLTHLSMGMSADYGVAIEEGATIVRVGQALFGGHH